MSRKEPNFKKSFLQKVIRDLREVPVLPRKILVAVSGGADSVGLLLALSEIQKLFRFQLTVGHVHHGISKDHRQNEFRNQAQQLAKELADSKGFQFLSNEPLETHLKSEADFRTYRYTWLIQWQEQHQLEAIALGHHFEDLLETQMMRLARGSARLGLGAMVPLSPQKRLRPFLNLKKAEVVQFVESMGEKWLEDPSNDQGENLRVQMRQWLEDLEGFKVQFTPGLRLLVNRFSVGLAFENAVGFNVSGNDDSMESFQSVAGTLSNDFPVYLSEGLGNSYVRPVLYAKSVPNGDTQFGLNGLFSTSKFWVQGGYNSFYGVSGGLGLTVSNAFSIGGLMEFGTDSSLSEEDSTFEIIASYHFGKTKPKEKELLSEGDCKLNSV